MSTRQPLKYAFLILAVLGLITGLLILSGSAIFTMAGPTEVRRQKTLDAVTKHMDGVEGKSPSLDLQLEFSAKTIYDLLHTAIDARRTVATQEMQLLWSSITNVLLSVALFAATVTHKP